MKKKYTKAKVEIIPLKTEAGICTGTGQNVTEAGGTQGGEGNNDPFGAKEFNGTGNGVNDFPFDPTPSTKE